MMALYIGIECVEELNLKKIQGAVPQNLTLIISTRIFRFSGVNKKFKCYELIFSK